MFFLENAFMSEPANRIYNFPTLIEGGRDSIERELVELLFRPGPTPKGELGRLMRLLEPASGCFSIISSQESTCDGASNRPVGSIMPVDDPD